MITLQQLHVFCAVAKHLHFTRAAEELALTQPAVTFHIRTLEKNLHLHLVDVQGHQVHLTAAGEFLLQRASEVLNAVDAMERNMREFADIQQGWLKLGATITIGNYVLPAILTRFHEQYPRIKISLDIANTARMEAGLLKRDLDLAVVEWRTESPEIELTPFQTDELLVATSMNHPFGQLEEIEAERLADQPFILREPGSGTRALAMQSLGPVAERIKVVLELESPEAIKRSVQAGLGVSIISETIIRADLERNAIAGLRLAGCRMQREFSLASLRARHQSPAAQAFAEFLLAWNKPDPVESQLPQQGASP